MFGSVLSYVTLRLLGDGPDGGEFNAVDRGRNWIQEHGGATYITSWGKFWLSVISNPLFLHSSILMRLMKILYFVYRLKFTDLDT